MHHRMRVQAGGLAGELIDDRLAEPRTGARRRNHQRPLPAEAGRFFGDTQQGAGCKHDTLMRRVVDEGCYGQGLCAISSLRARC
jgi:hypothetical protein